MTRLFFDLFDKPKPIIGMVHHNSRDGTRQAVAEHDIEVYASNGIDGVILENYGKGTVEDIIRSAKFINKHNFALKKGINVLPNEFPVAFELAVEYNLDFIQLDYVAGTYESFHNNEEFIALNEVYYSHYINTYPDIIVLGGVHPKYYSPISTLEKDIPVGIERSDAIVVTGKGTGMQTSIDKIKKFRELIIQTNEDFPLIVGAGVNLDNFKEQLDLTDGAIIGSAFKPEGRTSLPVNNQLVSSIVSKRNELYR